MRISAGHLKGKKINFKKVQKTAAKQDTLRPTSSKVRESVFNIISSLIVDAKFIDLYAGTGAVGIEALSRGASAVFLWKLTEKEQNR